MNIDNMEVNIFKALAHPIRLKIVKRLSSYQDGLCVCELNQDVDFSQSNLSQHLKVLREADIVKQRKEGSKIMYSIKNEEVNKMIELAETIILKEITNISQKIRR